jgi:hypothetical protein
VDADRHTRTAPGRDAFEDDLRQALAQLAASRDRLYYAEADTAARARFYATLDPDAPAVDRHRDTARITGQTCSG